MAAFWSHALMGLFDFLGNRKKPPNHKGLRELLFAAIEAGNLQGLAEMCERHHDEIIRDFSAWRSVPLAIGRDPGARQRYWHCMGTLADFFSRVRGEPRLLQQLAGPEKSNPIIKWQSKHQQADAWMNELRFDEVITLLTEWLNQARPIVDIHGNFVATNLALTYEYLGFSYFQVGRAEMAVEPLQRALDGCQRNGNTEGTIANLSNLFEVHRYLGQPDYAANYADRLSDAFRGQENAAEATWYWKQAAIVRAGEPLVRVIGMSRDQKYELDEVKVPPGVFVGFHYYRNRIALLRGMRCMAEAKTLWSQGNVEQALSKVLEASKIDPHDPDPLYKTGGILLYARGYAEAVQCYQRAEQLAPGWLHCRRFLWLARQLADGKLDHDTFLTLQSLDGERNDWTPEAKVALAREALSKTPKLAWLNLCLGGYLKGLQQPREAETAFRDGLEHAEEPDVKSSLLLELALILESSAPERASLLELVRNINGNLLASATADVMLKHENEMHRSN
jgi:tetratricopeptide (TPR) repeat protein